MAGDVSPSLRADSPAEVPAAARAVARATIVCPRCHGALESSGDDLVCGVCSTAYPVVDGVPDLSDLDREAPGAHYKLRQMEFFSGEAAEFEIKRPQGQPRLYGWLMAEKFRRSISGVESRLAGATVLTVCGGSGMDAEFLARQGATVVASDLAIGAAQRAVERGRRCGLAIDAVVADAEHLPFADRSVDIVFVHDGLHHLRDPMVGLAEMRRVARACVLVTEPSRAVVTSIAVRLGIALCEEDAGNRVERVSADQIVATLVDGGFDVVGVDRYAMYYQHEPGWGMRFFSRRRTFPMARLAITTFNRVLGSTGNKLSVRTVRKPT